MPVKTTKQAKELPFTEILCVLVYGNSTVSPKLVTT